MRRLLDRPTVNAALLMLISYNKDKFPDQYKSINRSSLRHGIVNKKSLMNDPYYIPIIGSRDDVEIKLIDQL